MSPEDPRHGSIAGAAAHATDGEPNCYRCRIAKARYQNETDRLRAYGRWQPWVDAEPARQHVRTLMAQGMPIVAIAAAVEVNSRRISHLLYGAGERAAPGKIRPDYAERVLSVHPEASRVDPVGVKRRLQGLVALGYPSPVLAVQLGMSQARVDQLLRRDEKVMRSTLDRVDEVFRRLSMTLPREETKLEKYRASRARNTAERNGWLPPLAWNDIDDPDERPARPEKADGRKKVDALLENAEWLADDDQTLSVVIDRLGVNRNTFRDACRREGRMDLYWRLANREANGDDRRATSDGIKRRKGVA